MYVELNMLIQLKLKNIALIEIIEINFEKGLNIFTGDSGSGKSLILDSLNVLFGGSNIPLKQLIRLGKDHCLIEARFSCSEGLKNWLKKNNINITGDEILVTRKSYKKNNKINTNFTVNKIPIVKKLLEELGLFLIDFAGQSDTFLFGSKDYRRLIIDDMGSLELKEVNDNVKKRWEELNKLYKRKEQLIAINKNAEEKNYAIKEMYNILIKANLDSSHEINDLKSKEIKLSKNFDINNSMQLSLNVLNGYGNEMPSVSSLLTDAIKHLDKISDFDCTINDLKNNLIDLQHNVQKMIISFTQYLDQLDNDEDTLDEIQNRLFFLQNLERTFSLELPELILKRDELRSHIDTNSYVEEINCLETEINSKQIELDNLYEVQTSFRKYTSNNLKESVLAILKNLGLANANFSIDFSRVKPSADGVDVINFLFSANPDQKLAPLSKIISGGEMSRFLLAMKSSISKKADTFFLDEIDNGLSGKSLFSLVQLIKNISQQRQVLCITHQPFLAANANAHFKVKKNVINGATFTSIAKLNTKNEKQSELIELIGGSFNDANHYASSLLDRAAA